MSYKRKHIFYYIYFFTCPNIWGVEVRRMSSRPPLQVKFHIINGNASLHLHQKYNKIVLEVETLKAISDSMY